MFVGVVYYIPFPGFPAVTVGVLFVGVDAHAEEFYICVVVVVVAVHAEVALLQVGFDAGTAGAVDVLVGLTGVVGETVAAVGDVARPAAVEVAAVYLEGDAVPAAAETVADAALQPAEVVVQGVGEVCEEFFFDVAYGVLLRGSSSLHIRARPV